jgi:hypothetical protein
VTEAGVARTGVCDEVLSAEIAAEAPQAPAMAQPAKTALFAGVRRSNVPRKLPGAISAN